MERSLEATLVRHQKPAWTVACVFFAATAAAAFVVALINRPAPQSTLTVPSAVTPANCRALASKAGVLNKPITMDGVGRYYTQWVRALSEPLPGVKRSAVTRTTLIEAGVAVEACFKS